MNVLQAAARDIQSRIPANYSSKLINNVVVIESPRLTLPLALIRHETGKLHASYHPGGIKVRQHVPSYRLPDRTPFTITRYEAEYDLEDPQSLYRLDADLTRFGLPLVEFSS